MYTQLAYKRSPAHESRRKCVDEHLAKTVHLLLHIKCHECHVVDERLVLGLVGLGRWGARSGFRLFRAGFGGVVDGGAL